MKKIYSTILLLLIWSINNPLFSQDTLTAKSDTLVFFGQVSVWGQTHFNEAPYAQLGARYIPSLNYKIKFPKNRQLDFEGAANLVGSVSSVPFDTMVSEGSIHPYRFWGRYSTSQLEIRLGLQKINFGSASMLRPLMWFDQLDPRDPLKLTNGVWGLLGRYYFLNNANLWLWCLYGNDKPRSWDIGSTHKNIPEFGGRVQHPVLKGEMALSYHFREVDLRNLGFASPEFADIPEHRIGIDGRFDTKIGLWFEGSWTNKTKNIGILTNQEIFNVGTDYTFGIGNGLHVVFEQLFYASDEHPFEFEKNISFSGLLFNYPLGIVDNISAIVYYDWENNNSYNFVNWNHQFKNLSFYLMTYWNPDRYNLPQEGGTNNTFAGPGFQVMFVYNH
jgi:hypothetical protein